MSSDETNAQKSKVSDNRDHEKVTHIKTNQSLNMETHTKATEFTSESFESFKLLNDTAQSTKNNEASHFEKIPPFITTPEPLKTKLYKYSTDSMTGRILTKLSDTFISPDNTTHAGSAFAGFSALLLLTCANYMLSPMRDAAALEVGVDYIPLLTLASTILALGSSVPVGWLFEAPNPERKGIAWRGKVGLTRGETQGTSLALFYRFFALTLIGYAAVFKLVEIYSDDKPTSEKKALKLQAEEETIKNSLKTFLTIVLKMESLQSFFYAVLGFVKLVLSKFGWGFYVAFFLVVHLMKLHSLSLLWGVTSEAMEYEEIAEAREKKKLYGDQKLFESTQSLNGMTPSVNQNTEQQSQKPSTSGRSRARLKKLSFVGFGGTLGGILGSIIASSAAHVLHLSGLLVVAAIFIVMSAELSIELGKIMLRHWQEEQSLLLKSESDESLNSKVHGNSASKLSSENVDSCLRRTTSVGSMKRVASGAAINDLSRENSSNSEKKFNEDSKKSEKETVDDNSFRQRLFRGVTTILRSRLLMTIFTYNALYATTSVLLSFQRAELVGNRPKPTSADPSSNVDSDTAFLARINMASSVAVFALQASGVGPLIASSCGQRGTLVLIPIVRLFGSLMLAWWHVKGDGRPPNLTLFLVLDEFTKVINFAVAKPVREGLWRGLSNEARYEAKPIVDTLANRWGGGSAACLTSLLTKIMDFTGIGEIGPDGRQALLGFPPILILCSFSSVWWAIVSTDLGHIRHRIDLELKKQQ